MKFPKLLFRRKHRDLQSILDYETKEDLTDALAGKFRTNSITSHETNDDTTEIVPEKTTVVDWKFPIFDADTTTIQTLEHELERLTALHSYNILETKGGEVFDRITTLASEIFDTPIAFINLIDLGRTWIVSGHGTGDSCGSSRAMSFCAHTIHRKENRPLIVPDATKDVRFKNFDIVIGPPFIRFYAGAPLISPEGFNLGAFCIMDVVPRAQGLLEFEIEILQDLANMAVQTMDERREKLMEYQNEYDHDTQYNDMFNFDKFKELMGPDITDMKKLVETINTLIQPLPKQVPITIEIDSKVPDQIECNDVLLLRSTLTLLHHSAKRTDCGSIQLRILLKKKQIVFECIDTGPILQVKTREDIAKCFMTSSQYPLLTTLATIIRTMGGDYGIDTKSVDCTTFWFGIPLLLVRDSITRLNMGSIKSFELLTIHSANQVIEPNDNKITIPKLKGIGVIPDPFLDVGHYDGFFTTNDETKSG